MRNRSLFMLVPLKLALGFAIAYVDSSPGWDDTGVSAAAVLGVSGLFGLLYPPRPWLWGLAVGTWIPAFGIVREFNYASVLALGSRLPALMREPWCTGSSSPTGDL